MTSKTDSTGTKTYAHDNLYRLTGITSGTSTITYGYDNAGNRTSMTSPSATIGYSYDTVNRMTQKTETIAGKAYSTSYGYDANDNITSQTYPSTRAISYGYNGNNQVTSITGFGGSVTSVNYNTAGLPTSFNTSNGITNNFSYNARNLATAITAGSALNLSYGYDSRGNTTSITNQLDSTKNQSFGYDALSRLTGFNGAWGSGSFGYDSLGNRTSKAVTGASTSYTYSSNRLSSASGGEAATYSYYGNGTLSGGSWQGGNYTLAYDAFNNLQTYSSGASALASFSYDGDGQRVTKSASGKTTVYHYDQAGHVISEDDGTGTLIADYVHLNGKLVAKIAGTPTITATPSTDSFGSIIVNSSSPPHIVTIKNTGTAGLVLGTTTLTGTNSTDFVKTTDGCTGQTLAPSANCTVQITFNPVTTGTKSASISIPSNDPQTPTFNVLLNGTAVLPSLTVSKTGTGAGTVTSAPVGISCGSACSSAFTTGASIALTPTPDTNSSFVGWSGACTGTGTCQFTMNDNKAVTATFNTLPPVASFSASPTSGGTPFTANFTDTSQRAASWSWNFGDGSTSTAQNPSHTYTTPGSYTVTLTAANASGSTTATKTINVLAALIANNTGTGAGTVTSLPAGISCGSTCSSTFSPGISVTLTPTPDSNSTFAGWSGACTGTAPCQLTMNDNKAVTATFNIIPPVAAFSAAPTSGGTPFIATITDQSQRASSWSWNFGDGTTSTEQNPSHVYKTPGSYTVTLTATNASGSSAAQKTITVTGCQKQPVRIQETSAYYPSLTAALGAAVDGQTIQLQEWNFVEGAIITKSVTLDGGYDCGYTTKTGQSVLEGEFRLSGGAIKMKDVHITGIAPSGLPVIFVTPSSDSFGSAIVGSASGVHTFTIGNTGGAILSIGTVALSGDEFVKTADACTGLALTPGTSCATRVAFAPTATGARTATLAITSNDSATPSAGIALNGIGRNPDITVSKAGAGAGTVTSQPADISCGDVCTGSFAPGAVTLSAAADSDSLFAGWSGGGCSGTGVCSLTLATDTQVTATFNQKPVAVNFSATPQTGGDPLLVTFTNLSQYATSWSWNFGDGTTGSDFSPTHVYRTPGTYTAILTAGNASGTATSQKSITVNACQTLPVRINGTTPVYYQTLAAALSVVTDNQTIQLQDRTFAEGGTIGKSITVEGGFDCNYSPVKTGSTVLQGEYHINAGAVTLRDVHVAK